MAVFITMWRSDSRECILVIGDSSSELRLLRDHSVIRKATTTSAAMAVYLANAWERS